MPLKLADPAGRGAGGTFRSGPPSSCRRLLGTPTGVAPNSAAAFPLVSLARFPCIRPTTGADLKEGVPIIRVRDRGWVTVNPG
jgi:hypothetical protein